MARLRGQIISGNPAYSTVGHYTDGSAGGTQPNDKVQPRSNIVKTPGNDYRNNYVGGNNNDQGVVRDRHAILTTGTETSGRLSGWHDQILDGPARPSLLTINRTINAQAGFGQANADDLTRQYNRVSTGQLAGQQDGSVQPVYGGTPGMWIPYGSYGGYTQGQVKGIQSGVQPGMPGDGPQKIVSGPPHGLHTATFPAGSQALGRYMSIPQQIAPGTSRPFNSKIAGQSYSQTVAPLGQVGTVAIQTQVAGTGSRKIGYTPGSGWRGR